MGKTCILQRYVKDEYSTQPPTIAGQYLRRSVGLSSGAEITLNVWDTAGQERFYSVTRQFFRHADAAIVVYDITKRGSFETIVSKWIDKLKAECDNPDIIIGLAGNKCDLESEREVQAEEGRALAASLGMAFQETSAAASIGINELFQDIAEQLASVKGKSDAGPALVQLNLEPQRSGGCPC